VAYKDLREFIARLEREGELKRIGFPIDVDLEISEITDRVSKTSGPALLFEKPRSGADGRDYTMPLLINALGSKRRMELSLEVDSVEQVAQRIEDLLELKPPEGFFDKLRMLPRLAEIGSFMPRNVKGGPAQEVIEKDAPNLNELPINKSWPQDGGRFITFPIVVTRSPRTGRRNVGCYRMQVFDSCTTGMHWQIHKGGAEHFRWLERQGKGRRMEVAVAIGADPATMLAGILPLPADLDEFLFAGFLRREPVELMRCLTVDLDVPAQAEIVLEGYVDLDDIRTEGPFGDHTGFYTLEDQFPAFHITCVTRRKHPVYVATLVGRPPMEDYWMGFAIERLFLPLMKKQVPEVVDIHMPAEGVFHNLMIVAIRKGYPGQPRKVMNAIWGLPGAMFTKCIVVVDEDVNVHDVKEVAWKAFNNIDPERDFQFTLGPIDQLDHASRMPSFGSKFGVDATRKGSFEGFTRRWPDEIVMSEEVRKRIDSLWPKLGL
jgi:4-hydroxy-3-polyprenylbenzoate decarboxylase